MVTKILLQIKDLVFLAGGCRGLDKLLKDSQAHESDVFHHNRCLYIYGHEEQAEGCEDRKGRKVLEICHNCFIN